MAKTYYLPNADKERAVWLKNFANKFSGYATTLGFTAADVTAVNNDSVYFSYVLDIIETFRTELRERNSYKDILRDGPLGAPLGALPTVPTLPAAPTAVPSGVFARVSSIVKRMKAHPAYTEAIGKDCGVIGSEMSAATVVLKPALTINQEGGNVIIKFTKGNASAVQLLSKRGTETDFSLLNIVTKSSYKDTRPNLVAGQPETRVYKAWYMQNDEAIGQVSDEVKYVI